MISKMGATPRVPLRSTANKKPGATANKKGTTPTATSATPKHRAADQMSGSITDEKGTYNLRK